MKVLVTGGAGYLGSIVVSELVSKGYDVRVFDKLYFGKEGLTDSLKRIEIVQGDIRKPNKTIFNNIEAVVHLAGLSNDPSAEFNPKANEQINTRATKTLANICINKGIKRFTFASSASVYDKGLKATEELQDETSELNPLAAYSKSKYNAENILLELSQQNKDFCPVILRQGTIYGQSPRMRYDLVVNTFVKKAFINNRLKVFCKGDQWRPLVSIRDCARAHLACLEADEEKIKGEIFNVSYDNFRILDVAHRVKDALKDIINVEIDVDYKSGRIDRSYQISNKKLEEKLGFRYKISINESVQEMAENIKDFLDKERKIIDLEAPIYHNIAWLEHLVDMEKRIEQIGGSVF